MLTSSIKFKTKISLDQEVVKEFKVNMIQVIFKLKVILAFKITKEE